MAPGTQMQLPLNIEKLRRMIVSRFLSYLRASLFLIITSHFKYQT